MQCSQGTFLESGVHAVNLPVIEKLTQLGLCQLQRDGVCRSRGLLIVWTCGRHMAYSSNAVVQFLPAGTSFKQVHFYSGIEGTTGRLCRSVKSNWTKAEAEQQARSTETWQKRKFCQLNAETEKESRVEIWTLACQSVAPSKETRESAHRLTLGVSPWSVFFILSPTLLGYTEPSRSLSSFLSFLCSWCKHDLDLHQRPDMRTGQSQHTGISAVSV